MFNKFRRSRQKGKDHAVAPEDDDEPMRGTPFKRGAPKAGFGSRQPLPYDGRQAQRQQQHGLGGRQRMPSQGRGGRPALRNQASNTRNKLSAAPHSGVSWVSDTCSETDVTETWTTDLYSSDPSLQGSSRSYEGGEGSVDSQSQGEVSRGGLSRDSSSGYSEHEESARSDMNVSHSEVSGILFSSVEGKAVAERGSAQEAAATPYSPGASTSGSKDDEDASYASVGESVVRSYRKKPPPPPQRQAGAGVRRSSVESRGSMMDSIVSLGEASAKSSTSSSSRASKGDKKKGHVNNHKSTRRSHRGEREATRELGQKVGRHRSSSSHSRGTKDGDEMASKSGKTTGENTAVTNNTRGAALPKGNVTTANATAKGALPYEPQERSMKLKPPSMKGMPGRKAQRDDKHRRSSSGEPSPSAPIVSSGATVATSVSDSQKSATTANTGNGSHTEVAAMQQLAYLVVSLRSDLREASLARDKLETKLKEEKEKNQAVSSSKSDDSRIQQLEKDNADLQADLDAFIAEQDDMRNEIKQLHEDKSSLNDMIARLKREASVERSRSSNSSSSNQSGSVSGSLRAVPGPEELQGRVKELTVENHKLEREIQLLVGEKSDLRSSSDSRTCEIEQLHRALKENQLLFGEKELVMKGMKERIDSLENTLGGMEKDLKEANLSIMVLEDEVQMKEGEMKELRKSSSDESNKLVLLRQRLAQVEKQRGEMAERNSALDGVMLGMKKKCEEMLKERNANRSELEKLRRVKKSMTDELDGLKVESSKAIAMEAKGSDTLLNLQKMIASLEERKDFLEEELDHKDAQMKLDSVKMMQLEEKVRAQEGLLVEDAAQISQLEEKIFQERQRLEEELNDKDAQIKQLGLKLKVQQELSHSQCENEDEEAVYLKECMADLSAEREEMESKVLDLEERIAQLFSEKEEMETKMQDLVGQADNLAAEKRKSESKVNDLEEHVDGLSAENEELESKVDDMQSKVREVELERACLEDELEGSRLDAAKTTKDLEEQLKDLEERLGALNSQLEGSCTDVEEEERSKRALEEQSQASLDTISNLQRLIAQLQEAKAMLEEEMHEATDAIAMLEDELDQKDARVKEVLMKLTIMQQQFSQVDKCKTALAERNAKLSSDNDDLSTQVKVLIIEKKVASEEIETLKTMKTIADEDQEEALLKKEEQRQEVDRLTERLEEKHNRSQGKILSLEQRVYRLEEDKTKLEEDLGESSDAVALLREALMELEDEKAGRESKIDELKATLDDRENCLSAIEAAQRKLQSEHQISVDTIAALQKMISSLETSNEDLEQELNASSSELVDLKEQMKGRNAPAGAKDLEDGLRRARERLERAEERNTTLSGHVAELTEANETMKCQVKDLGESLTKAIATQRQQQMLTLPASLEGATTPLSKDLVSKDPVVSCDALISELKSQIKAIVSARNAALEEIEFLKSDGASVSTGSHATIPPPARSGAELKPMVEETPEPLDDSFKTVEPQEDEQTTKTKDHSTAANSNNSNSRSQISNSQSNAGSRGSSLLEAAKKLCDQLDEKRSKAELEHEVAIEGAANLYRAELNPEKVSNSVVVSEKRSRVDLESERANAVVAASAPEESKTVMPKDEEPVKDVVDQDIDDNISAREVKEDAPPLREQAERRTDARSHEEEKKEDLNHPQRSSSSKSRGRFDIDQLTSIYFEKCGMSVSKLSDLSSDSSSFRRRVKGPTDTVTKKVKICRNGIFMGTYEGDLNADGQRHGFGVLLCDNGNSYEGEWRKDKRDGLGIARYSSGDVYDGQWQRGKRQGHGVMYIEAGDTYIGSWNNGLKHGAGTYHWADGEVDVSWYQEDRRVGEGVRWNASRSRAYRLIRGTKKEELSLDEAYVTAEKLGLNLEKFDSGVP